MQALGTTAASLTTTMPSSEPPDKAARGTSWIVVSLAAATGWPSAAVTSSRAGTCMGGDESGWQLQSRRLGLRAPQRLLRTPGARTMNDDDKMMGNASLAALIMIMHTSQGLQGLQQGLGS
jgi:hypothetical protein